ncbi:MAG: hypothetical protein GJT30_03300 [Geobacter sp.]|nr:hypothetical protein [Geobacter sp.]
MRRLMRALACMLTLFVAATAIATATDGPSADIHDIRGPVRPSGLPPFAASAAILILAAGVLLFRLPGRKGRDSLPDAAADPLLAELLALRDAHQRGELTDSLLFERLSQLLRSLLPAENRPSLTGRELIEGARGIVPEEALGTMALLFDRCDRVRFGGVAPGKGDADTALDDALGVAQNLTGVGR